MCPPLSQGTIAISARRVKAKDAHPDIVEHFQYPSSWYLITLPEALEEVVPEELKKRTTRRADSRSRERSARQATP